MGEQRTSVDPSHPGVAQRPWLKYVGIGCGSLLLAGAVIGAVIFFVVKSLTAEPEREARAFMAAAVAGDYASAHDYFSVPLKETQSLEAFTAAAKANPSLFDVKDVSFSNRSIDAASGATLEGTATLRAGTRVPISFRLVKENDKWKIISYHIGAN